MDVENCQALKHILEAGIRFIKAGNLADGLESVRAVIDCLSEFIRNGEERKTILSCQQLIDNDFPSCDGGGVLQKMMNLGLQSLMRMKERISRVSETILPWSEAEWQNTQIQKNCAGTKILRVAAAGSRL